MIKYLGILCALVIFVFSSCSREDSLFAEDVPSIGNPVENIGTPDYLRDIGRVNINVIANGNPQNEYATTFIKGIWEENSSYCHPDVQYFSEGFRGYRYWMVFTPYFGAVGTDLNAKRFENPTVVVSNDGLNWVSPVGIESPLQKTASLAESFVDQKREPKQGFWSDVDWLYINNRFYLYSRASFFTASALKNRGNKSLNNSKKLVKNAQRAIVQQSSVDGIRWTPLEVAFTSNLPYTPANNHLLSPSFVFSGDSYFCYEVELNTGAKNFKGKDGSYVIQRKSKDGLNFSSFKESKIVNFLNTPWTKVNVKYSPWHIHATYVDGFYFLTLAVGDVSRYSSEALYVAYSCDGVNFKVFGKPLVEKNAYRSAIFKMYADDESIDFGAMIGLKDGSFHYREFKVSKEKLLNNIL